jgi:hypothetical protein
MVWPSGVWYCQPEPLTRQRAVVARGAAEAGCPLVEAVAARAVDAEHARRIAATGGDAVELAGRAVGPAGAEGAAVLGRHEGAAVDRLVGLAGDQDEQAPVSYLKKKPAYFLEAEAT